MGRERRGGDGNGKQWLPLSIQRSGTDWIGWEWKVEDRNGKERMEVESSGTDSNEVKRIGMEGIGMVFTNPFSQEVYHARRFNQEVYHAMF